MSATPREEWRLTTRHIGRRVLVFDRLDSTNTFAAGLATDSETQGVAVLADVQTAGRGQHGRTWSASAGVGVLLSVLLSPPAPLRRPALLTAWAAVAVCEAVRDATGLQPTIKWPNDVLVQGRKVCGILLEQQSGQAGKSHTTIAGIGLNVRQTADDFDRAGLPVAGSLAMFAEHTPEVPDMARRLLQQLDDQFDRLLQGDLESLERRWTERLGLLGQFVRVECADGLRRGRLLELGFDGLHLEQDKGDLLCLQPEQVLHLYLE